LAQISSILLILTFLAGILLSLLSEVVQLLEDITKDLPFFDMELTEGGQGEIRASSKLSGGDILRFPTFEERIPTSLDIIAFPL
jgi:hypothetical protein